MKLKRFSAKGDITLDVIIGLVVAIAIFWPGVSIANSYLRLSSKALEDFNKLDSLIDEVSSSDVGTILSMDFAMDDETAVLFFRNESIDYSTTQSRQVYYGAYYGEAEKAKTYHADIPEECKNSKGCLCLARKVSLSGDTIVLDQNSLRCSTKSYSMLGIQLISRGVIPDDKSKNKILYAEKIPNAVFLCAELTNNSCAPKLSVTWTAS